MATAMAIAKRPTAYLALALSYDPSFMNMERIHREFLGC
jgi:hypothetical protein